jgi:oligopeptide transport system substrate-binding protein
VKSAAIILLCLLLPGCGRNQPVNGSLPSSMVQAKVSAAHLHRHMVQAPRTLDPSLSIDVAGQTLTDDLFEGLVRLDPDGKIVPAVAERWEVSDDGLHWRFFLRSDARWSNGDAVTAEDFVFAWRRVVNPATASQAAQQLAPVAMALQIASGAVDSAHLGVTAVDAHTLDITLSSPTPYFLYLLSNCSFAPLHAPTLKKYGEAWTRPGNLVGNGAFLLKSMTLNGPIELVRNPLYVGAASVRLQKVSYLPLPDNAASTARYLAGDLDITDSFMLDDVRWLRQSVGAELRLAPYVGTIMLGMHTARPPFNNKLLRKAMTMALDREVLTRQLLRGLVLPAYGIVAPLPDYPSVLPAWATLTDSARLAEARRLYAAAGYSKERPLRIELSYPTTNPDTRRVIEALAAMWRLNLGADIRLANEEWRVHVQNRGMHKLKLFWFGWTGDYPDPLTFLALPVTGNPQNYGLYSNPAYDAAVAAAMSANAASRNAHYLEAERILNDDAVLIPVYYLQSRHLLRSYVKGWADNPMDRHLSRDLYLAGAP